MPILQFGLIIKRRREELGYTQEELADGICSVPTLSRIENGERMPTKEHFEMLLQRLGYSDTTLNAYVDEKQFYFHELKFKIRQALILNQPESARELLLEYEENLEKPAQIDKQFILLYQTLLNPASFTAAEQLKRLESAIRLTCPKYDSNKLPIILSYEEIILLNSIAVTYGVLKEYEKSIRILYYLKRYYEDHIITPEEVLRTQPMILYNLSKYLGQAGRYDECIEICNLGIRIARETGRCSTLSKLLFNRAWAAVRQQKPDSMENSYTSARLAYYSALVMGQEQSAEHYLHFIKENFPQKELL